MLDEEVRILLERFDVKRLEPENEALDKRTLSMLQSRPHLAYLKRSTARPYLLVLCKINGVNTATLIERTPTGSEKKVHAFFHDSLFEENVILSGLMTQVKGRDLFTIIDVLGIGHKDMIRTNICERMMIAYDFLARLYIPDSLTPFDIETCDYRQYEDFDALAKDAWAAGRSAKIVFKSMHLKFGDIEATFIPPAIDAAIGPSKDGERKFFWAARLPRPDTFILFDESRGVQGLRRRAGIDSLERSRYMASLFSGRVGLDERVKISCVFNERLSSWLPELH
jgi:hypothetical protein